MAPSATIARDSSCRRNSFALDAVVIGFHSQCLQTLICATNELYPIASMSADAKVILPRPDRGHAMGADENRTWEVRRLFRTATARKRVVFRRMGAAPCLASVAASLSQSRSTRGQNSMSCDSDSVMRFGMHPAGVRQESPGRKPWDKRREHRISPEGRSRSKAVCRSLSIAMGMYNAVIMVRRPAAPPLGGLG